MSDAQGRSGAAGQDPRRQAWRAMMETYGRILSVLERELVAATGIDLQCYDVLLHLSEAGKPGLRMNELAKAVVISKSGLTSLVDRMADRGLVERAPDPSDRRAVLVALTPGGANRFREAARVHLAGVDEHFCRHLTPAQGRTLASILSSVHEREAVTSSTPS